ncbi:hypothetical protein ElyMa_002033400 [Elysia marginata]|uniref:Uncharacterized protein n=1 Tax=Elysia marginata TaxID=1093978 RepID=A0AAV4F6B1_9GAST|nr:hypothetical protein ElyMa_002033400 [Elysia marginata]
MYMRSAKCFFFPFFYAEPAILRPYRRVASRYIPKDFGQEDLGDETGGHRRYTTSHNNYHRSPHISGNFRPNPRRCCQVGERVAQKQMSCDITVLAMLRKYYNKLWMSSRLHTVSSSMTRDWHGYKYHYQRRLSEKVAKCSAAQPRQFVKCCTVEDSFLRHLKRCQQAAGSRDGRRRCRQAYNRRKWKYS